MWHSPPYARSACRTPQARPSLYLIQDSSDPEWKTHVDEACNIFQDHYHDGWAYMARYAQHMFQLQHDTQCTVPCASS
jgi:hypothetical protein